MLHIQKQYSAVRLIVKIYCMCPYVTVELINKLSSFVDQIVCKAAIQVWNPVFQLCNKIKLSITTSVDFTSGYAEFFWVYFKQRKYFWKAGKDSIYGDQRVQRYHKEGRFLRSRGGSPPYIPELTVTCVPLLLRLLPFTCRASLSSTYS